MPGRSALHEDNARPDERTRLLGTLAPPLSAISIVFLVAGAALATVPIFVSSELGLGAWAIGLIAGSQFIAALCSRLSAGRYSDTRGPKKAVVSGLLMTMAAGIICTLAYFLRSSPLAAAAVLLIGRTILGSAESFIITGAQSWALAVAGPGRSAQVIGWAGTALFLALALGAPLGGLLQGTWGFWAVGVFSTITPALVLASILGLPEVIPERGHALHLGAVFVQVRVFGAIMALVGFGYGAMVSFGVLLFAERGWFPTWGALTAFSIGLVIARLAIGSLPDRLGGVRAAALLLVVNTLGFGALTIATHHVVGLAAAFVAGFGYSVVYPALGREAVRRVPARDRGIAMAVYSAFIDVSLGLGSPILGIAAGAFGAASVFGFACASAVLAMGLLSMLAMGTRGGRV